MDEKKVLLVEDDESLRIMYETKFKQQGAKVISAQDGAEALEKANKEKPDLILLDVILPQLDGFSVLEELKKNKETEKMPVIMLTNLSTEEDKEKAKKLGAIDYIVKATLTPTEVGELIKKYL
jgi:two-component system, OmpR family, alkaline phosphatase synthesis response regulator PhoP